MIVSQLLSGKLAAEAIKDFQTPQLLVFSYEYALATLLKSWGLAADSAIGYSLGEYVAACLSGIFRLEDAIEVLIERGRLMDGLNTGKMIGVPSIRRGSSTLLKK